MIIVSNSSPLITFARISLFRLLHRLFVDVLIPEQVYNEVVVKGAGQPGALEAQRASWIQVKSIADTTLFALWRSSYNLGEGEIATIILAKEVSADLALIDERKARLLAKSEGLEVIGSVGLLEECCRRGHVTDLRQTYQELLSKGIWIDRRVLDQSLLSFNLPPL